MIEIHNHDLVCDKYNIEQKICQFDRQIEVLCDCGFFFPIICFCWYLFGMNRNGDILRESFSDKIMVCYS